MKKIFLVMFTLPWVPLTIVLMVFILVPIAFFVFRFFAPEVEIEPVETTAPVEEVYDEPFYRLDR